jgi:LytS/YehU family sensor histidine kinase
MYRFRFPFNWLTICLSILVCTAGGTFLFTLCCLAFHVIGRGEFWATYWVKTQFSAVLALVFGGGMVAYRVLRSDLDATTLELKSKLLEQERAGKLAAEAQLASLESHVRPHFLFNTLNTISSLIPDEPKHAESLVGNLANLLRLSLDSSQERISSLERELKLINDYLEIERARFGDRLRCTIDVPAALRSTAVPTLVLQTLVENSVKHAVASRFEGANIRIEAFALDDSVIVRVSDDGPGFTAVAIRPGHGLDNVQRRLDALFGSDGSMEISKSGDFTMVSLRLPLNKRTIA